MKPADEFWRHGKCPYLGEKASLTHYRIYLDASLTIFQHHLEEGWRRFGPLFFRPECPGCNKCESLRIDLANFSYSRSQRRNLRRNADLTLQLSRLQLTQAHLDLFARFHAYRATTRGWDGGSITPHEYWGQFVAAGGVFGWEARYYDGERLICVDLFDVGEDGISAVYCYWEPEAAHRGLGHYSLLMQIDLARKINRRYLYLGYGVRENASLTYKFSYAPLQRLEAYPNEGEMPNWVALN